MSDAANAADLAKAGSELVDWICGRIAALTYAQHLESEGHEGKVMQAIDALDAGMRDGTLASYRLQFEEAGKELGHG